MGRRHHSRAGERVVAVAHGKQLRDFRRSYRRTAVAVIVVSQLAVSLGLGGLLLLFQFSHWHDPSFWLLTIGLWAGGSGLLLALLPLITEPMLGVLAALAHKTGEPTTLTPPNPNAKRHEATGYKTVLQAIYATEPTTAPTAESSTLLSRALNHTSCGIVVLNPKKQIISANTAAPIAKRPDGTLYLALDFLDDVSLDDWLAEMEAKAISGERQWRRVSTSPHAPLEQKLYDITASYQRGQPGETVIVLFDRSAQYLPEEEDLNFIAFAAHELRGPITVIRGYLDVLEQELADRLHGDEHELMERLTVSANRLSSYINNILNVARFDRHHLKVHLVEDTVAHIYASIADDMQLRAQTQHRLLSVTIPDNLPTVAADRGSIGEVIANLIDNAIKYSFEGGVITVTAEQKGDFVEVAVSDNGVGMPANVVENLFRKFYRSHRSRETVAGTGIGLYICKAFVESHGGNITARSREHEGSTFSFTLPIYDTVKDKLLEDGQLNQRLIRHGGGWIKNHAMYRE